MVTDRRAVVGSGESATGAGDCEQLTITDLKVHMLGAPGASNGLLRIIAEAGLEGWCYPITAEVARVLTGVFRDKLVGQDAMRRERIWHDLLCGTFEELKLHSAAAAKLGIDLTNVTPLQATRAYTDFLLANAFAGTLGELAAALAPCVRLYHYLGVRLAQDGRPVHAYTSWIETYSAPEYANLVDRMDGLLDRYGQGTELENDRYRQAMQLEYGFFDEAWKGGA